MGQRTPGPLAKSLLLLIHLCQTCLARGGGYIHHARTHTGRMPLSPHRYAQITFLSPTGPIGPRAGRVHRERAVPQGKPSAVYVLQLAGGYVYVGKSTNVDRRVRQHTDGLGARFTRRHRPTGKLLPRLGVLQVRQCPPRSCAPRPRVVPEGGLLVIQTPPPVTP